ncbi:glycerate kinase [Desertivirga brevis]|uniref:glycerate kinase n=1 Tax=Desertivirga brevis TaxID=2810310 RepID=UPI001A96E64A|nr:glycerate kinase [Pedobacter sp. SYSU D00873]
MKIIVAPDKFKGSLTSIEACEAIKTAISSNSKTTEVVQLPLSDGGDGLLEALTQNASLEIRNLTVLDPLFRPVDTSYLISGDNSAFIEMAKASGLLLLNSGERNPALTSSYGTGELIKDAIQKGARRITLGIGGSATNDAGMGMAAALGFRFYDNSGKGLMPIGQNLGRIESIDSSNAIDLSTLKIEVACDVTNIFHGVNGAAYVFGPQKGANAIMVRELDEGLAHVAGIIKRDQGIDLQKIQGSGAAGGLGGGAIAFLGAKLRSGIELVLEHSRAEEKIQRADLVISGEGKLDHQSLNGKVISGISSLCKKHNKPLIVVCGRNELRVEEYKAAGIIRVYSIIEYAEDQASAIDKASYWLESVTARAMGEFSNGV